MTPSKQQQSTDQSGQPSEQAEQRSGQSEVASGTQPVENEFAKLSYEQARDALVDVVRRLEGGAETLEESLALWERGEALAKHCEQWLAGAQARLNQSQT